jgi:hypothetical protein
MPASRTPRSRTRKQGGRRPARQRHTRAQEAKHAKHGGTGTRTGTRTAKGRRWSHKVMEHSDALDLEHDIFRSGSPQEIAQSLKHSAEQSRRRKGSAFQSAMSMLNFYVNRAGKNLPQTRRDALQKAKQKLREAFGREK